MKPLSAPLPSARRREELFLRRPSPAASPATIFAVLFALLLTLPGCGSGPTARPAPTPVPTVSGGATCSMAQQQPDQGNAHMNDLGHIYPFHPATSGPHYPVPLPPQPAVFTSEVPEARAVHNLEHGYVVVYFQSEGADSLPAASLEALRSAVPGERRTLLAPYHALPAGVALALTAWRVLQTCTREVSAGEAKDALAAFATKYRDSSAAPEPGAR